MYTLGIAFWQLCHQSELQFPQIKSRTGLLELLTKSGEKNAEGDICAPLHFSENVAESIKALVKRMCCIDMERRPSVEDICDVLRKLVPIELGSSKNVAIAHDGCSSGDKVPNVSHEVLFSLLLFVRSNILHLRVMFIFRRDSCID